VESDVNIRFDRTKNRWENLDEKNLTLEQFMENAKAETETRIKELKNISHFVINNDWKIENLYKEIDKIMNEL
jgi:dephospho-CoA kinase